MITQAEQRPKCIIADSCLSHGKIRPFSYPLSSKATTKSKKIFLFSRPCSGTENWDSSALVIRLRHRYPAYRLINSGQVVVDSPHSRFVGCFLNKRSNGPGNRRASGLAGRLGAITME